jgi:hypothetical protein
MSELSFTKSVVTKHSPFGDLNVSGILLATRFSTWHNPTASFRLWHNPWALKPYGSRLARLPQAVPTDGRIKFVDGESVNSILGYP